jgi:hypothetical protein
MVEIGIVPVRVHETLVAMGMAVRLTWRVVR